MTLPYSLQRLSRSFKINFPGDSTQITTHVSRSIQPTTGEEDMNFIKAAVKSVVIQDTKRKAFWRTPLTLLNTAGMTGIVLFLGSQIAQKPLSARDLLGLSTGAGVASTLLAPWVKKNHEQDELEKATPALKLLEKPKD